MQISKHVVRGIISDIILVSLYSWLVCAEDDDAALHKGVHFPKSQNVLPVVVGRHKRGFGVIDTGNRAYEITFSSTVSQTTTSSYRTSDATTPLSFQLEKLTAAVATTVSKPSTPPDRTSVSTTPQSHPPEKLAAVATTTLKAETTIQIVSSTTGGNVTDSTKQTTTSAGHVISKTLAYISFIIINAEHTLF